jgi:hypothetical protein
MPQRWRWIMVDGQIKKRQADDGVVSVELRGGTR